MNNFNQTIARHSSLQFRLFRALGIIALGMLLLVYACSLYQSVPARELPHIQQLDVNGQPEGTASPSVSTSPEENTWLYKTFGKNGLVAAAAVSGILCLGIGIPFAGRNWKRVQASKQEIRGMKRKNS